MIKSMKKLSLIALKSDCERLIEDLMWLRCVQIKPSEERSGGDTSEADGLSEAAQTLSSALDILAPKRVKKKMFAAPDEFSKEAFDAFSPEDRYLASAGEAVRLKAEADALEQDKSKSLSRISALSPFLSCDTPTGFGGTAATSFRLGAVPSTADIAVLRAALEAETDGKCVVTEHSRDSQAIYISLIFMKADEKAVSSCLSSAGFTASQLRGGMTAEDETAFEKERIAKADDRLNEISGRMFVLAEDCDGMERDYDIVMSKLNNRKTAGSLLSTEATVVIEGYVPSDRAEKLEKKLSKYVCCYELSEPENPDEVPVLLKNNAFATPFESIIGLYSYPKYKTFDPTFIMSIFYAVIFGLMFADVGYGLVLLLAGFIGGHLTRHKKGTSRFLKMFGICGIFSVLSGVMMGSYFGDLPKEICRNIFGVESFPDLYVWFDPIDSPMTFFAVSIGIGAVHMITGMVIKMIMQFRTGDWIGAVFDTGSWLVIFAGLGLYFTVGKAGVFVALAGVLMIVLMKGRDKKNPVLRLFSGILGLYDGVSIASDLLSYSRVLALGLSSAVIAMVVNILATLGGGSIMSVILFPLVFLLGHLLNMALGVLGGFVHTSRLQYIEFFNKFYEDGGDPFMPLEPAAKYTVLPETSEKA